MVKNTINMRPVLKYLRLTLLVVGLVLFFDQQTLKSQCFGEINLKSQADVDDFTKNYGNCKFVKFLYIWNENGSINNLDSLYRLEEIWELNLIYGGIKSYKGLDNVRKIQSFGITLDSIHPPFRSLDTIYHMGIKFENENVDLSMMSNVRHIYSLGVAGNGKLTGLEPFTCGGNFRFVISDRNKPTTDISNLMPQDRIYNGKIELGGINNITLNGLAKIDYAESLLIGSIAKCDLTELRNIISVGEIRVSSIGTDMVYGEGISNAFSADIITVSDQNIPFRIGDLLPNIRKINRTLTIGRNNAYIDMTVLKDLQAITGEPIERGFIGRLGNLEISLNSVPLDCNMPIVCRTLKERPSYVFIQENSDLSCDKATILSSCLSATDDSDQTLLDKFPYPNPFTDELILPSQSPSLKIAIYNTAGQQMEIIDQTDDKINTSSWPSGLYFIQYLEKNKTIYKKAIKQ